MGPESGPAVRQDFPTATLVYGCRHAFGSLSMTKIRSRCRKAIEHLYEFCSHPNQSSREAFRSSILGGSASKGER